MTHPQVYHQGGILAHILIQQIGLPVDRLEEDHGTAGQVEGTGVAGGVGKEGVGVVSLLQVEGQVQGLTGVGVELPIGP